MTKFAGKRRFAASPRSRMFRGVLLTVPEAVERYGAPGVTMSLVHARMHRRGWTFEDAVLTPRLAHGGYVKGTLTRYASHVTIQE